MSTQPSCFGFLIVSRSGRFYCIYARRSGVGDGQFISLLRCKCSGGAFPHYMVWLSMYSSLTEREVQRIFWYTNRKLFALGRYITDELLSPLDVPR